MNLNQYTTKSQEAIQKAQQIALDFGHQSIEPQHLLEGILQVDENISAFLMKKSEADLNLIREKKPRSLRKTFKSRRWKHLSFSISEQNSVRRTEYCQKNGR